MSRDSENNDTHARSVSRRRLWSIVGLMGLVLILSFSWALLSGIVTGSATHDIRGEQPTVVAGGSALYRANGMLVWIVRYSAEDDIANSLTSQLVVTGPGCLSVVNEFCYLDARGRNPEFIVRYVEERPDQFPRNAHWAGGFVDPSNGALYDRQGRGYLVNPEGALPFLAQVEIP